MIMKNRARSPAARGTISTGVHPHGIGGIDGHELHVELNIGEMRVFVSLTEWRDSQAAVDQLLKGI
jgi:hypothetical protein